MHKARWISKNRMVACKSIIVRDIKQDTLLKKSFFKELSAYMELSGGYILTTYAYAVKQDANKETYMIITEYMARGSLASLLRQKEKIPLRRKVQMAREIASGMRKIHEHGMIHRDIRPDNILVNENYTAKIGDMGISRVVDSLNRHTRIGCDSFMPPEYYIGTYDQKLDIFTFGLTLNELFTETEHGFNSSARKKITLLIESPVFPDLIARCTSDNPKHRPAAIEIEKTLEFYCHAFDQQGHSKNPSYTRLSIEQKNEIFIKFYQKLHPSATHFIHQQFPEQFRRGPAAPHVRMNYNSSPDNSSRTVRRGLFVAWTIRRKTIRRGTIRRRNNSSQDNSSRLCKSITMCS